MSFWSLLAMWLSYNFTVPLLPATHIHHLWCSWSERASRLSCPVYLLKEFSGLLSLIENDFSPVSPREMTLTGSLSHPLWGDFLLHSLLLPSPCSAFLLWECGRVWGSLEEVGNCWNWVVKKGWGGGCGDSDEEGMGQEKEGGFEER